MASSGCSYDVIIVGGGPAGSVAAYHLAQRGFRVALFELRDWNDVWGKPCGDAIGAHHFSNAGLPEPPARAIRNRVYGVMIFSPSRETVYLVRGEGYIVDRRELGRWILSAAEKHGAEIHTNAYVIKPVIEGTYVKGVVASLGGRRAECRAKVVIEASGFAMAVKRRLPREWLVAEGIDPRDTNIAYREIHEYEVEIEKPEFIRIYINQELAPGGYWWFFPEGVNRANVGVGVQGGVGNPPPQQKLREILERGLAPRAARLLEAGGAVVPTRRPQDTLVWNGLVVIGDAAYTVNPLHGGGMGYAFYSAKLAANAIEEAHEKGCFSMECLWRLNVEYMRSLGAKQAALDLFRMFLQRLDNEDIEFGMRNRLVPEVDVYEVSSRGELKLSIVEKALIALRGLKRPSLLAKLRVVAEYMSRVRRLYKMYPERPEELDKWRLERDALYEEFKRKLGV